jgi:hypothetical protein
MAGVVISVPWFQQPPPREDDYTLSHNVYLILSLSFTHSIIINQYHRFHITTAGMSSIAAMSLAFDGRYEFDGGHEFDV